MQNLEKHNQSPFFQSLARNFYHLEEYDKAIVYFEEYKLSKEMLTEDQLYQISL